MVGMQAKRLQSMPTSEQIKRNSSDPDELDFNALRKEAIGHVQDLCGHTWTDYNLHDPGVTILEQACYGLTDLAYRSGFEVADYLTDEAGSIDYERHALFSPQDILPSSPVTKTDYEKVIYDAIPDITNIWFKKTSGNDNDAALTSLYTVFVQIDDDLLFQTQAGTLEENECLSEIAGQLSALNKTLAAVRATIDQIGHRLDAKQHILKKWCSREYGASPHEFDELINQGGEVLSLLDNILSHLDNIRGKLDDIWSILVDSQQTPALISDLDNLLSKLENVISKPTFITQLDQILAKLTVSLSRTENLAPLLSKLVPKLGPPFAKLEMILCELDKDLFKVSKAMLVPGDISEPAIKQQKEAEIKQKVISLFAGQRNFCEDIHSVQIIKTNAYFLVGEIEVYSSQSPAKIYADIFFKCIQYISSSIQIDRYETVFSQENSYDQAFTGPLTTHGFISDKHFETTQNTLSVVDLITLISQIDGVSQIHNLSLMDQDNQKHMNISYAPSQCVVPGLCFPHPGKPMQMLRLVFPQNVKSGNAQRPVGFESFETARDDALLQETKLELKKLIFEYHAFRSDSQSWAKFIRSPKGQQRELQNYHSIQNHFPAIYGINKYGIPPSKPNETKAKAKQLKAYLYPYEQLMANYLQNLQEIPTLFSLDDTLKQSYFSQFLDNKNIPDIEALYAGDKAQVQPLISDILVSYDDYEDRRSRVLDTLLAIHGEQFTQKSLQRFNHYRKTDTNDWIIENKIHFLKCIKEISRDRAKGLDYLAPSFNTKESIQTENIPGTHKKIGILLGLSRYNEAQLITHVLTKRDSCLLADKVFAKKSEPLPKDQQSEAVPMPDIFDVTHAKNNMLAELPPFSTSMFKAGIDLENYRIVRSDQEAVVCLRTEQDGQLWPLASKNSFNEAVRYAQEFCSTTTQLNMACENFHIIEHLLLRPRGRDSFSGVTNQEAFYNFRVSVIFPSWTARFSDKSFRKFAQETMQRNLPAHIFPEFYWLDFVYVQDFEQRYKTWLQLMQQTNQENDASFYEKLDHASEKIITFLLRNKQQSGCERWV
jgi:hypothetical protein